MAAKKDSFQTLTDDDIKRLETLKDFNALQVALINRPDLITNELALRLLRNREIMDALGCYLAQHITSGFSIYVWDKGWGPEGAMEVITYAQSTEDAQYKVAKFCIEYGEDAVFVRRNILSKIKLSTLVLHCATQKLRFSFNRRTNIATILE